MFKHLFAKAELSGIKSHTSTLIPLAVAMRLDVKYWGKPQCWALTGNLAVISSGPWKAPGLELWPCDRGTMTAVQAALSLIRFPHHRIRQLCLSEFRGGLWSQTTRVEAPPLALSDPEPLVYAPASQIPQHEHPKVINNGARGGLNAIKPAVPGAQQARLRGLGGGRKSSSWTGGARPAGP